MRATGLQSDAPPEIIEILDDDTNAFERAANHTIVDNGGPRWIGPVAAVALAALIGYGVATSASSSGVPTVAPVPSTSVPKIRPRPVPTTTVPADTPPVVPYYAADPPREYAVASAEFQDPPPNRFGGHYQLWATDGATATTGSWFSIESSGAGPETPYTVDAYRVQSADKSIALSHLATGQSVAEFSLAGYLPVRLISFGWSDDLLVRLVQSTVANGDNVVLTDPALIPGYRMISTVTPWLAIESNPVEQVFYAWSGNPKTGIGISVGQRLDSNEGGSTLDRQIALRFLLESATSFGVDGHFAVAGTVVGERDLALATWIAGDHIVTVKGSMPVEELIPVASTVHQISAEGWNGMKFQASVRNADNRFGAFDETDSVPVSFGTDAAARPWTIQATIARFPTHQEINWRWDDHQFVSLASPTATIDTIVDSSRTYVLADLPRAAAATAELRIIRDGLEPVVVNFNDLGPALDRTFAAYAFSEAVPYTATIIGSDGAVIASWPST